MAESDYLLDYSGDEINRRLGLVDTQQGLTALLSGKQNTLSNPVTGSAAPLVVWTGTQAQYDAIPTKNANTLYFVTQ